MAQSNRQQVFKMWPGLTTAAVDKHLKLTEVIVKGHMQQTRKNLISTKKASQTVAEEEVPQEKNNEETQLVFATIHEYDELGRIYTDQNGRFPVTSSKGNKYVMALYSYDANAIMAEPIKNKTDAELTRAYVKNKRV
eukprot:2299571-Ditylum_brightwellii.AAC.1